MFVYYQKNCFFYFQNWLEMVEFLFGSFVWIFFGPLFGSLKTYINQSIIQETRFKSQESRVKSQESRVKSQKSKVKSKEE